VALLSFFFGIFLETTRWRIETRGLVVICDF
jgi:hypothetical protein